jgi:hypothetical protein
LAREDASVGWFSRNVSVTFIDEATGEAFATTKMPPADLPESFAISTTLHLGESDWYVVHAEPRTRADYTKSGSLNLRLRKVEKIATEAISFSQVDITERFDDNRSLGKDEWISTTPLNSNIKNPEAAGLPSLGTDSEVVYRVASKLSALRESIPIPDDGVYCPICHIANVDLGKLRTPCPKCGRELLKFGWT